MEKRIYCTINRESMRVANCMNKRVTTNEYFPFSKELCKFIVSSIYSTICYSLFFICRLPFPISTLCYSDFSLFPALLLAWLAGWLDGMFVCFCQQQSTLKQTILSVAFELKSIVPETVFYVVYCALGAAKTQPFSLLDKLTLLLVGLFA